MLSFIFSITFIYLHFTVSCYPPLTFISLRKIQEVLHKKYVFKDSEIKRMREELLETFKLNTEKGSLDKVRNDHSNLLVEIERLKIERDTLNEVSNKLNGLRLMK